MSNRDEAKWGVWCVVSGGVTGHRQDWLKENGQRWEGTIDAAMDKEDGLIREIERRPTGSLDYRAATFHYNAREIPAKCACGGEYEMDRHCGARVCWSCQDHKGLARCYCGWTSHGGGGGEAELAEMGEYVGAPEDY